MLRRGTRVLVIDHRSSYDGRRGIIVRRSWLPTAFEILIDGEKETILFFRPVKLLRSKADKP